MNSQLQETLAQMKLAQDSGKISLFRFNVLSQLLKIPKGRITTYGQLAKSINCHSAQAIGQALKANPWAPLAPCHRVIKSDLSIGGFFGQRSGEQITKKQKLLQSEGLSFNNQGKLIQTDAIYNFDKDIK
jgi:methylated-DNA-[protein]-cysteine S-methyltransferase